MVAIQEIIVTDDEYIQTMYERHGRLNRFYMSKARAKGECISLCKTKTFPIAKLLTKAQKTQTATTKYYLKHKQMGLARCRNCDYITAYAISSGARCPCCKNKFSRFIRKSSVEQQPHRQENEPVGQQQQEVKSLLKAELPTTIETRI